MNHNWEGISRKMYQVDNKTAKEMGLPMGEENLSPCPKCNCMTRSVRLGRAKYECGKCKADKSLSDVYFYEATQNMKKVTDK